MDFLTQYALFLAKTITVLLSIISILLLLFALKMKQKQKDGQIIVRDLSTQLQETSAMMSLAIVKDKSSLKKLKYSYKQLKKEAEETLNTKPNLFVLKFTGDITANQTTALRECITAILLIAQPQDEVLVILESSGGLVHSYGLAAAQLQRLRTKPLFLTIAIDKIAASGGYMMAVVANKIIASPFAVVGSIGVVATVPNFNRLLEQHNIDCEQFTAGKYKRTVTMFGKNTDEARNKFKQELEEIHTLFKDHIHALRPSIDLAAVATGEHWHALSAKKYNLIDEILVSDDYILQKISTHNIFAIQYEEKQKLQHKIKQLILSTVNSLYAKFTGLEW